MTPVGLLLPGRDELALSAVTSKVTSDCLVDILCRWWEINKARFPRVKTLLLNFDNGPECHSRRTQFLSRRVAFVAKTGITLDLLHNSPLPSHRAFGCNLIFLHYARGLLQLAYYPPYHSKYNPVERCWGVLENHWNGDLLDSVATVLAFARSMTWKGTHPTVELMTKTYPLGVRLTQKAMAVLETKVHRLPGLGKWFVEIRPDTLSDGRIIYS